MISIQKVAAISFSEDDRYQELELRRFLCIANWLRVELHIVVAENRAKKVEARLRYLRNEIGSERSVFIFQVRGLETREVIEAMDATAPDLMILESVDWKLIPVLFEKAKVPVMLLPDPYGSTAIIPRSLIVPLSSEERKSDALELALSFAERSKTPVDLMHVMGKGIEGEKDELSLETVSDQFHHEYSKIVDRAVAIASPLSTSSEKKWIRSYYRCSGPISEQIARIASRRGTSAIILDWHGTLAPGRARLIKQLLLESAHPIVLVKQGKKARMSLKVGKELKSA